MRPLLLKISAFGPYAGEITIPMEELGEQGLYLITGDTGAGKTTIFDAICYALFGEPSGNNRETSMLRSKYASPETATWVELTFLHAGKTYTVRRNPEYTRPNKRGDGTTKQVADAELHMPDGQTITKVRDVTEAVEKLLGVNREQFSQIAMLAQGDFLKLLLADTKQRQEIFRELFKTGYYQALQYRLEDARKEVFGKCQDAKRSVEQYVADIEVDQDNVLALEVEKAQKGSMPITDVLALLEKLDDEDLKASDKQEALRKDSDEKLAIVNKNIGAAEETEKIRRNLEDIVLKIEVEASKIAELSEKREAAFKRLADKESLLKEASALETELPQYDAYDQIERVIAIAQKQIAKLQNEKEAVLEEENKRNIMLTSMKREQAELKDAGVNREKLIGKERDAAAQEDALSALAEKLNRRKGMCSELLKLQKQYAQNNAEFQDVKTKFDKMDQLFRDGQAGVLASNLQEGQPCPVCGSTSHPMLAVLPDEIPTKEELEAMKDEVEAAREKAEQSSSKAGQSKAALELFESELMQDMKELIHTEDLEQGTVLVMQSVEEIREERAKLGQLISEENRKVARKQELDELLPKQEQDIEALRSRMTILESELKELTGKTNAQCEQAADIRKKLKFDSAAGAKEEVSRLNSAAAQLQKEYDQADNLLKGQSEIVSTMNGQKAGFKQSLEQAPDIDIEMEQETRSDLLRIIQDANNTLSRINSRKDRNAGIKLNIQKKSGELAELEKNLQWITALSETANGKIRGKEKIMLETYIQTTYFDRIIRRANLRLLKMSGEQYELKRASEAYSNKGQSGLELSVIDHYNGSERSVKTLSGGESFMASLSLALGLSDEVQSIAGGIRIDTMFVDEGFGALDPESLELAYSALAGLTEGKRLVGIISHVADLKDRIDKQIVVTKQKSGGSKAELNV